MGHSREIRDSEIVVAGADSTPLVGSDSRLLRFLKPRFENLSLRLSSGE
jgi:hypothetical protein